MIYLYIIPLGILSWFVASCFPSFYKKEKQRVLMQLSSLNQESIEINGHPVAALFIFVSPVLIYYFSDDMVLSACCFVLATLAYTDLSARWLPDPLVFLFMAITVYSVRDGLFLSSVISSLLFVFPAIILNGISLYGGKAYPVAAGDFYVIPIVGLLIPPEFSLFIMMIILLLVAYLPDKDKGKPLVTIVYVVFTGYLLCEHLAMV